MTPADISREQLLHIMEGLSACMLHMSRREESAKTSAQVSLWLARAIELDLLNTNDFLEHLHGGSQWEGLS